MQWPFARQTGEVGQGVERDVDFARRSAHAEVLYCLRELIREVLALDELQERALRIGRRHHRLRAQLVAVGQRDTGRATAFDYDLLHGRVRAHFDAKCLRRTRDCRRHATGSILGKTPGAERTVDLAHVVMEQHVRRSRRTRAEECADDTARRLRTLERIELEPLVEQVGGRLRH